MKLRRPTDFLILEALAETGRNVATNLESSTGKSRQNINTRLPILNDYELVRKIGPADRSGLYEITPLGKAALAHKDQYDEVGDFVVLIDESVLDPATQDEVGSASLARIGVEERNNE